MAFYLKEAVNLESAFFLSLLSLSSLQVFQPEAIHKKYSIGVCLHAICSIIGVDCMLACNLHRLSHSISISIMRFVLLWSCLLIGAATVAAAAAAKVPRGMDPKQAAFFTGAGGVFTCFDKSKQIPFEQVNDDYCDCADGSDEPGKISPSLWGLTLDLSQVYASQATSYFLADPVLDDRSPHLTFDALLIPQDLRHATTGDFSA